MKMVSSGTQLEQRLSIALADILKHLGTGRMDSNVYDTAWVARLAKRYPDDGFQAALTWLADNQHDDGTWGTPFAYFHDKYISTLAAIIALQDNDSEKYQSLIAAGERALWHMVDNLPTDDQDTVGFPILSISMRREAQALGLDVPQAARRFEEKYFQKIEALVQQPKHEWKTSPLLTSLEALREWVNDDIDLFDNRYLIAASPAATAAYLLEYPHEKSLQALAQYQQPAPYGIYPPVIPIDTFEIAWSIAHLRNAGIITPNMPEIRTCLNLLCSAWSEKDGIGHSGDALIKDLDDTAAAFAALNWGGYAVTPDVFHYYEAEDHFQCYLNETDPSASVQIRSLMAILQIDDAYPHKQRWIEKALYAIREFGSTGAYFTDKWHTSPYYVNTIAIRTLASFDFALAKQRLDWVLATQNADGGWGYYQNSTPEETAYCLEILAWWHKNISLIDRHIIDTAAAYLLQHLDDTHYVPLWIAKCLYSPHFVVKSVVVSALYMYSALDIKNN